MGDTLRLGAIDTETKEYTTPYKASKQRQYQCADCNERVILRQGNIRIHHFSHFRQNNPCSYYDHPNESQIHKDAKLLMQSLLQKKRLISFTWNCDTGLCYNDYYFEEIPSFEYSDDDSIVLEYRDPNKQYIADIALINQGKIKCIIEIKHTHRTTTKRPEPWYEIDASKFITYVQDMNTECKEFVDKPDFVFNIPCIRTDLQRKCYGSFCYKESWVRRIPGYDKNLSDKSCLLCKRIDYTPISDGCTGKFQNGEIRLCYPCALKDIFEKKIPSLYKDSIVRTKNMLIWGEKGSIKVKQEQVDSFSKEEKEILSKVPILWRKFGEEVRWHQELQCSSCRREQYSPIYFEKKYYAICKICLGNKESQKNLLEKFSISSNLPKSKCLITDD